MKGSEIYVINMKAWEATVRKTQAVARRRAHTIFGTYGAATVEELNDEDQDVENVNEVVRNIYDIIYTQSLYI